MCSMHYFKINKISENQRKLHETNKVTNLKKPKKIILLAVSTHGHQEFKYSINWHLFKDTKQKKHSNGNTQFY